MGNEPDSEYQTLISLYEKAKSQRQFSKTSLMLLICITSIVCLMKIFHENVTPILNAIASIVVGFLLICYFYNFKKQRNLDKNFVEVAINGLKTEKEHPFSERSYFRTNIRKLNLWGEIASTAIFDFAVIYFFSVLITQALKSINPEIVTKLMSTTQLRTLFIACCLVYYYYKPFRPLARIQKEIS